MARYFQVDRWQGRWIDGDMQMDTPFFSRVGPTGMGLFALLDPWTPSCFLACRRHLAASRRDQDGSMSRVFDAVSHRIAYADNLAARAASTKCLCRMCPASTCQRQLLQPHGEWIQVVSECAESMAVMQLSTLCCCMRQMRAQL